MYILQIAATFNYARNEVKTTLTFITPPYVPLSKCCNYYFTIVRVPIIRYLHNTSAANSIFTNENTFIIARTKQANFE